MRDPPLHFICHASKKILISDRIVLAHLIRHILPCLHSRAPLFINNDETLSRLSF